MSPTILVIDDNKELVALLTSLFEEDGYTVVSATKGKQAVDVGRDARPRLAIIDVLLPDMMGYHVAESLRAVVPDITLFFMSGVFKGSRHSTEAMTRFPGALYFEKPFDAKALLQEVKRRMPPSVSAVSAAPAAPQPPTPEYEVELDIDVDDMPEDAMELTGKIKVTGAGNISAELRGEALTAAKGMGGPVSGERPMSSSNSVMQDQLSPPTGRRPARQGLLTDNLPGLITAFYLANETGELYVQRGKVKKVVYFERGQPVFAMSNLAADRFGQFLVRVGKIKPEQLQDAAVVAAASKRRTGDVLVERGLLKDTERLYFVGQQVKSIIYSLFGWEQGQFVVTFSEKARAEAIKLDAFPGNLIVRGVKKLYKPERLARLVKTEDRLMPSGQPPYQLHEIELEKWEASLLAKIDGTRTNSEVYALAGRAEHQVSAFLAAMLGLQILERRET